MNDFWIGIGVLVAWVIYGAAFVALDMWAGESSDPRWSDPVPRPQRRRAGFKR